MQSISVNDTLKVLNSEVMKVHLDLFSLNPACSSFDITSSSPQMILFQLASDDDIINICFSAKISLKEVVFCPLEDGWCRQDTKQVAIISEQTLVGIDNEVILLCSSTPTARRHERSNFLNWIPLEGAAKISSTLGSG